MFTWGKPHRATSSVARSMSAAVWHRPMARSTFSSKVWGFTETRVTPWLRSTASFSAVMVSGRPASTVISSQAVRSKEVSKAVRTRSICSAVRVVGVPPPM